MGQIERLWYQLYRTKGIGVKTMHNIYEAVREGEIELDALFDMTFDELRFRLGLNKNTCLEINKTGEDEHFKQEFDELLNNDIKIIHLQHADYPQKVYKKLGTDSPPILFCIGDTGLLNVPSAAIAGSRDASDFGIDIARRIGEGLAMRGKCAVSGYARGIDSAAHMGAIEMGGNTAFILCQGIYHFTQKGDFKILEDKKNFVVVSQFHPHEVWRGRNAMMRNRVTVALSEAVIIVECGKKEDQFGHLSGTFNTGETALDIGVPLYVISPEFDANHLEGNIELIKMGGIEVGLEDVIEMVAGEG